MKRLEFDQQVKYDKGKDGYGLLYITDLVRKNYFRESIDIKFLYKVS